jgi:hypothetical protein
MSVRAHFVTVLALAILLAAMLFVAVPAARAQAPVGTIVQQRGPCTVLREATSAALTVGAPVFPTDRIVTGPEARIKVQFADGTVVSVGSDSVVAIVDYVVAPERTRLKATLSLVLGVLRAVLPAGAAAGSFDVEGRTAVASARSTDFVVDTRPDHTAVFVAAGRVGVAGKTAGPANTVVLEPGFGTDVPAGSPPSPPIRWGQRRMDDAIARTTVP